MLTRRIVIGACALSLAIPAAAGASPATDPPKANGPYSITSTTYPKLVKAKGPYGATLKTDPQNATRATAHPASASSTGGVNDWRTAAISEGALLAALALGSAWLLSARRHAPRLGT